jgi:hypothetical protein
MRERIGLAAALVCASVALVLPGAGAADTTFTVGCSTGDFISAIEAANDETANPGADHISLQAGCTYAFSSRYGSGETALPPITSHIIIYGNGATIERASGAPSMTLIQTAASGILYLSDVTLTKGWGSGENRGADVDNKGEAEVIGVTVTDTPPLGQQGAALRNAKNGQLAVVNSTISHLRDLDGDAGGIANQGYLVVTGSTFDDDRALDLTGPASNGGAIENSAVSSHDPIPVAEISDSTFTNNGAQATGGAIRNTGTLQIERSSFVGNGGSNFGGAIETGGSTADVTIENSYFADNTAGIGGGALDNEADGLVQIVNSTFYGNVASNQNAGGYGGAIENYHGVRVEASTFDANRAQHGATVASRDGIVSFESSVIDHSSSDPCLGTIADFSFDVVFPSVGSCPSGFTVSDPKLTTAPANHGGSTFTLALGAGSAAVDIVSTGSCQSTDQRGFSRPAGAKCDAGAFEDQLPSVPGAPFVTSGGNPNQGSFHLAWSVSTDPDGSSPSYRLYHKDANDSDFSQAATAPSAGYAFAPEAEGTWIYEVAADDGNHVTALSSPSSPVVVDRTPPTAPNAAPDRAPDAAGWYRDSVTVTFSGSTDPSLPDGSPGSGVASITSPQTRNTSGVFDVDGKATDAAGNDSATTILTVHVDAEPPSIAFTSCPSDVILGSTASATWSASDPSSGLATPASGSIALDTSGIGTKSVSASATDQVGHNASATCTYRVIFDWSGFLNPLLNAPTVQTWTAGDGAPVSFTLAGDQGLAVFAAGYPQSAPISCTSPADQTTGTPTTSKKGLEFKGGRYRYLWSTDTAWAGTCRQLIVKLTDGTYHRANFRFN